MKSDFTRLTFDRARHYTRVLFQQGRPPLDADFNEQAEILLRYSRQATADIIGPHGAPSETKGAFAIGSLPDKATVKNLNNLNIGKGRYYVDGLLCENDSSPPKNKPDDPESSWSYLQQPYWPSRKESSPKLADLADGLGEDKDIVLAYLHVWEHHRTWLDDGAMRDVALGGGETSARSQIVWRVSVLSGKSSELTTNQAATFAKAAAAKSKAARDAAYVNLLKSLNGLRGALRVRLTNPGAHGGGCGCGSGTARYRGIENQLYRLEIHHTGHALSLTFPAPNADDKTVKTYEKALAQAATFKWSRENGCVAARWLKPNDCDGPNTLRIEGAHDQAHGFVAGEWVEILDEASELRREPGLFVRLQNVEGDLLTVDRLPVWADFNHPKVRRWDQVDTGDNYFREGAVTIREAIDGKLWLPLENGIEVQFVPPAAGEINKYRTGDFWIFAVRAGTGRIEWPTPVPEAPEVAPGIRPMPPYGIDDHYAPLALVTNVSGSKPLEFIDLRRKFPPYAKLL